MGSTIEYNRVVYHIPPGSEWFDEERYVVIGEYGECNVRDYYTNDIPRDWHMLKPMSPEAFNAYLERVHYDAAGGMLKGGVGRKNYRSVNPDMLVAKYKRIARKKLSIENIPDLFSLSITVYGRETMEDMLRMHDPKTQSAYESLASGLPVRINNVGWNNDNKGCEYVSLHAATKQTIEQQIYIIEKMRHRGNIEVRVMGGLGYLGRRAKQKAYTSGVLPDILRVGYEYS